MTLHLRNIQKIIIFSMKQFERDVNLLRAAAGIRQHDMGVLCADTQYVNQLQKDIKKISEHDGLLVFPYNEKSLYWTPGQMPTPKVEYNLGDIILDMPKIYQASKDEYLNIYSMMTLMMTKGISQLMGSTEAEALFRKECEILNRYNQLTGAHLEPFYPEAAAHPPPQKQAMA